MKKGNFRAKYAALIQEIDSSVDLSFDFLQNESHLRSEINDLLESLAIGDVVEDSCATYKSFSEYEHSHFLAKPKRNFEFEALNAEDFVKLRATFRQDYISNANALDESIAEVNKKPGEAAEVIDASARPTEFLQQLEYFLSRIDDYLQESVHLNTASQPPVTASVENSPDSAALVSPSAKKSAGSGRGGRGGGGAGGGGAGSKRPAGGPRSASKASSGASDVHADILGADGSTAAGAAAGESGEGHPEGGDHFPFPQPPAKKRQSGGGAASAAAAGAGGKGHHHRNEISTHLEGDGSNFSGSLLNPYASNKAKQARSHLHPVEILKALYVDLEAQGLNIYGSEAAMKQIPLKKVIEGGSDTAAASAAPVGGVSVKMEEDQSSVAAAVPSVKVESESGEPSTASADGNDTSAAAAAATAVHRSSPVLNLLSVVGGMDGSSAGAGASVSPSDDTSAAGATTSAATASAVAGAGVEATKPVAVSRAASTVSLLISVNMHY